MIVWRMRIACWIPKTINTQPEYVILTVVPLQQYLHEIASMLHHTHTVCLVTALRAAKIYLVRLYSFPSNFTRPAAHTHTHTFKDSSIPKEKISIVSFNF
jgi:hypothetical protein